MFVTPTAMIWIAKVCRARNRQYPNERLVYKGLNHLSYANNLGFADALNLEGQPFRQGAFGGQNYIPISVMDREALEVDQEREGLELGDVLERKCNDIARIVEQGQDEALHKIIARSFCEIFRNCFEHGEAEAVVYCAQYWPANNEVEICIADRGIGVMASLNESRDTKPSNDREALFFSLMPGVSSKAWRHKKKKAHQKSHWDNAGYGLFFAHRLFGSLGTFQIASMGHLLVISNGVVSEHSIDIEGTLVSMRLNLADSEGISEALTELLHLASVVRERLGVRGLSFASVEAFIRSGEVQ